MVLEIARAQAWHSFRQLYAAAAQFFGGFVAVFLILSQALHYPLKDSLLWGIVGYLAVYTLFFGTRFLRAINARMTELTQQLSQSASPISALYPYTYRSIDVRRYLLFNPNTLELDLSASAHMRLRSNSDRLPFVRHGMGVGENKSVRFKDMNLTPKCARFRRVNGEIHFARTQSTDVTQRWRIVFTPDLALGEEAAYEVEWGFPAARFLSFEEFDEARKRLELPSDREYDSFARSTPVPCDRFLSSVQFPARYRVQEPDFAVTKGGHPIQLELDRLSTDGSFSVEEPRLNRGWRLTLDVGNPVPGVSYVLKWKPPHLDLLVESGLLDDNQRKSVADRLWGTRVTRTDPGGSQTHAPSAPTIGVAYRAFLADTGWAPWVSDGEVAGTTGRAQRMEALEVRLTGAARELSIRYRAHVQHFGWMGWVSDGATAGTTGQGLRLEALRIVLDNATPGFHIKYQAHVETEGWMDWHSDGEVAGTTGQSRRLEAIRILLTVPELSPGPES